MWLLMLLKLQMKTTFHIKHQSCLHIDIAWMLTLLIGALHTDAKRSWDLLVLGFVRVFMLINHIKLLQFR